MTLTSPPGKKEYRNWLKEQDLWELSNPETPTFEAGTRTDAILLAAGTYIPEGLLPEEPEPDRREESSDIYPVYVAEKVILGNHMAYTYHFSQ